MRENNVKLFGDQFMKNIEELITGLKSGRK